MDHDAELDDIHEQVETGATLRAMTEPDLEERQADQEPDLDELFDDEPTPPLPPNWAKRLSDRLPSGCAIWMLMGSGVLTLLAVRPRRGAR